MAKAVAVVVGAGSGTRFGGIVPKQLLPLAGRPLLARTLEPFFACDAVERTVLVLPRQGFDDALALMAPHLEGRAVEAVRGGDTRQESVFQGVARVEGDGVLVAVHDGARPLVDVELVRRVIEAAEAEEEGGAIAAVPVVETLKEVSEDGLVERTVDRERFYRAQTPQCFRRALLVRALESARAAGFTGTDEAALVERLGVPVRVVAGSERNVKVTSQEDFVRVEALLRDEGR